MTTANVDYLQIGTINCINISLNITLSGMLGTTITLALPITPAAGFIAHYVVQAFTNTWGYCRASMAAGQGRLFTLPGAATGRPELS
jgi:hypothetical protein